MSMEIYVLSDRQIECLSSWQKVIDDEGLGLRLDDVRPFSKLGGYLPAVWRGAQAGFECDHWPVQDLLGEELIAKTGIAWSFALAFRWGGDLHAAQGAYSAAAAYARATDGVVFDPQSGEVLRADQALAMVRDMEAKFSQSQADLAKLVADISALYKQ